MTACRPAALRRAGADAGVTQVALAAMARVSVDTVRRYWRGEPVRQRTAKKLDDALRRVGEPAPPDGNGVLLNILQGMVAAVLEAEKAGDPRLERRLASYFAHVSLSIPQARIAAHFGLSKAAICQAVQRCEEDRDGPLAAIYDRIEKRLQG